MKLIVTIRNHPFRFSLFLLLAAFLFSRLPYFLWLSLPGILPDSFDYFNVADILQNGHLSDLGQQPIELPLGYPLFLSIADLICDKLTAIVFLQSIIKLLSCIYLSYQSCKYYKEFGIWVAVAMSIYLMNDVTIRWDTTLYSESVFSSSLIMLTAFFIRALNRKNLLSWALLGAWIFIPGFIRPNGAYVYLLIPFLFAFFYTTGVKRVNYFGLLAPALLLNMAWAGINTYAYGNFLPGNFVRLRHVVHVVRHPDTTIPERRMGNRAKIKFYLALSKTPQFYYSIWATRYENMYLHHQVADTSFRMYDETVPVTEHLKRTVYKEFYPASDNFSEQYKNLKNYHSVMGIWLEAYNLWYGFDELVLRNFAFFVVFILIVVYATVKWMMSRFTSPLYLLMVVLGFLHLGNILVVTLAHPVAQQRYIQVSEFVVYLTFAFLPLLFEKVDFKTYAE